jgi:hypothetical protein
MTGIGDRPHDHPLIGRRDRKHLGDQHLGFGRIGGDDAGDEAHVDTRAFHVLEGAELAQRLHRGRHARWLGPGAIVADPSADGVERREFDARRYRRRSRRGKAR